MSKKALIVAMFFTMLLATACTQRYFVPPRSAAVSATGSMVFAMSVNRALEGANFSDVKDKTIYVEVGAGLRESEGGLVATAVGKKVLENGGFLTIDKNKAEMILMVMIEEGGLDIYRTDAPFVMTISEKGSLKFTIYGFSNRSGKLQMMTSGEGSAQYKETYILGTGPTVEVE